MKNVARNIAAIFALVTAVSLAPVNARAFLGDEGQPQGGRHFKKIAAALGLSPQQKQDIKEIIKKNKPQTQPLIKQLITERRALRTLVQADTVDEAAIRAQSAKVAAIEADLAIQRAHATQEIRGLLTTEQVQKYKGIQAKRDRKLDDFMSRSPKQENPDN